MKIPTIDNTIEFNKQFVAEKRYEPFAAKRSAEKKIAIVACMDTRLVELLPAALGIENGQAKLIKNAGAMITHPDGSVMRSILVSIYALGVCEVMIIGHTDCGMRGMNASVLQKKMSDRGVTADLADMEWLCGFADDDDSVRNSVSIVKNHPMMPADIPVRGFMMDVVTGELREIK